MDMVELLAYSLGTTKGSARIPGYSGHIPAQPRNINTVTGEPAPNVKDHLVLYVRHLFLFLIIIIYHPSCVHCAHKLRHLFVRV